MQTTYSEPAVINPQSEIRLGRSSWDGQRFSIKYTWFTSTGAAARGGEVPVESLPQMIKVAIEQGRLEAADCLDAIAQAIRWDGWGVPAIHRPD
ncbi:MAG: hypothetical protein JHD07_08830 [Bradyrhizobium sp.]|uniref:hypothetical protein n=1 Tax=Bradyrhizobium sp. TaxID=376 RepID=UPI001A238E4D|nr:hypothetical protein [Bradyrhizobium sp.]MBJ7403382.1 hypothetical protein [Bradyrhizobium sp.]